jgi:DNA-binding NarL/FixJ family response regulator
MHRKELIEVLVVEDQIVVRKMIKAIVEQDAKFQVVAEAEDGEKGVALAKKLHPDIVLMDIEMPNKNGIDATGEVKMVCPRAKVIMLTTFGDDTEVLGSFSAGADGYCLKNESMDMLPSVISAVAKGAIWIDPGLSRRLHDIIVQLPPESAQLGFSKEEMSILKLLVEGLNNAEIAQALNIEQDVLRNQLRHMLGKLSNCDQARSAAADLRARLAQT